MCLQCTPRWDRSERKQVRGQKNENVKTYETTEKRASGILFTLRSPYSMRETDDGTIMDLPLTYLLYTAPQIMRAIRTKVNRGSTKDKCNYSSPYNTTFSFWSRFSRIIARTSSIRDRPEILGFQFIRIF